MIIISCNDDDEGIDISDISFDGNSIEVIEGFTLSLDELVNITGDDANKAEISFSSEDGAVVSVNGSTLTAVAVGSTSIMATESNTNLTATVTVNVIADLVAVTGVTLNNTTLDLKVGETSQLTATVTPDNATDNTLTWSVAEPSGRTNTGADDIAEIDDNGLVTAKSAGQVVVTAETTDGDFTASTTVSITNTSVTGVTLDMISLSVNIGETGQLVATIAPTDAYNKNVSWSLVLAGGRVDETYATVDAATGVVTGVSECDACGLALVATTEDGEFTASADVFVVKVLVTSISLNPSSEFDLDVGETQQMTATILPANATDQTITWTIEEFDNGMCRTDVASPDKATVDENGLTTGEIPTDGCSGLRVVATSVDGPSASTDFIVNPILVTNVEVRDNDGLVIPEKTLDLGDCPPNEYQLTFFTEPGNASDNSVIWTASGDPSFTVDADGLLTTNFSEPGTTRITATATDGSGESDYVDVIHIGCI